MAKTHKSAFFFQENFFNPIFNQYSTVHCLQVNRVVHQTEKHRNYEFLKISFSKNLLQILKLVHRVKLRPNSVSFWTWTTRLEPDRATESAHFATGNFHPFRTLPG